MSPVRCLVRVLLASLPAVSAAAQDPGNVLLVIADDLGVYELASYGEGTDPAITPTIDTLAAEGVRFRSCWSNPLCSTTRATILTGRYGLQTGVGGLLTQEWGLQLSEVTVAEMLHGGSTPYTTAFFGKWHLSNLKGGGYLAPNLQGFDHAIWTPDNLSPPTQTYFDWTWIEGGVPVATAGYVTTDTVDRALEFLETATQPWFVVLSFHAPHYPFHEPPAGLYTTDLTSPPPDDPRPLYKAMIEAMDTELGRFLGALEQEGTTADVIFVGDNGSPTGAIGPPGVDWKAKSTIYEGGINVPLIVSGPSVAQPGSESIALVNTTDVLATVLDLAGMPVTPDLGDGLALSSTSLVPYLSEPNLPSLRKTAYAELFFPGGFAATQFQSAVRDRRYKLHVKFEPLGVKLFDLHLDPFEEVNLLAAPLSPQAQKAFDALIAELIAKISTYGT